MEHPTVAKDESGIGSPLTVLAKRKAAAHVQTVHRKRLSLQEARWREPAVQVARALCTAGVMFGCRHEKLRAHDLELKYREQASRELALKSKADKQTAVLKEAAIETDVRNNDVWSLTLALRLA